MNLTEITPLRSPIHQTNMQTKKYVSSTQFPTVHEIIINLRKCETKSDSHSKQFDELRRHDSRN